MCTYIWLLFFTALSIILLAIRLLFVLNFKLARHLFYAWDTWTILLWICWASVNTLVDGWLRPMRLLRCTTAFTLVLAPTWKTIAIIRLKCLLSRNQKLAPTFLSMYMTKGIATVKIFRWAVWTSFEIRPIEIIWWIPRWHFGHKTTWTFLRLITLLLFEKLVQHLYRIYFI